MTARELFARIFHDIRNTGAIDMPIVYIDEATGAEIEIVDAVLEHGKIKLISKFIKDESEIEGKKYRETGI